MGRLDVQIRHGHDGGGWGAVVALIVFIVLAVGGAAHKQLGAAAHTMLTVVEVAAWTMAAVVMAGAAAGLGWLAFRIRRAVRGARARRPAAPVITLSPRQYGAVPPGDDHPALDPSRRSGSWPLPGQWGELRPHAGDDDDRRYS
jgi:hypothetical protein